MSVVAAEGRGPRIPAIDALRGIAIGAMIIYHFAWDLSAFGLYSVDVITDPGWRAFARTIAGTFIALVGVGLVLATREGFNRRAFLRRLAMIVGAAVLVTIGTYYWFPDAFVFFGILHLIAFASVAALPFLRMPVAVVLAAAVAILLLPFFFRHEAFDAPWLWWLGLMPRPPVTVDYVPVFPWFSMTLFGIVAGRLFLRYGIGTAFARWHAKGRFGRLAVLAGRWSLVVYLVHQPVLMGALSLVAPIAAVGATTPTQFMQACTTQCRTGGNDPDMCLSTCQCVMDGMPGIGLTLSADTSRLDALERDRWVGLVRTCVESAEPPLPEFPSGAQPTPPSPPPSPP